MGIPDWDAADARRILPRVIDGVVYTGIASEIPDIRQTLAEEWGVYSGHATIHRWLTELCDEVERLRADTQELNAGWTECAVERDAALAEVERLRARLREGWGDS